MALKLSMYVLILQHSINCCKYNLQAASPRVVFFPFNPPLRFFFKWEIKNTLWVIFIFMGDISSFYFKIIYSSSPAAALSPRYESSFQVSRRQRRVLKTHPAFSLMTISPCKSAELWMHNYYSQFWSSYPKINLTSYHYN